MSTQKPDELASTLLAAVHEIDAFDRDCEEAEWTDTEQAWAVFRMVRLHLTNALKSLGAQPPDKPTEDVEPATPTFD